MKIAPYIGIFAPYSNYDNKFTVCLCRHRETEHIKDVVKIAEFNSRIEAEIFINEIEDALKLCKPNKIMCNFYK